jgi:hypothetical protein
MSASNNQTVDINLNINVNLNINTMDAEAITTYESPLDDVFDDELDEARSMPDDKKDALFKVVDVLMTKGEKDFCVSLMTEAPLFVIAEHLLLCLGEDIEGFSLGQAYLVVENFKNRQDKGTLQ